MPVKYYENNCRVFLMVFLTIICFFGMQKVVIVSDHSWIDFDKIIYSHIQSNLDVKNATSEVSSITFGFLKNLYNLVYTEVLNIPIIFWFLIVLNIFIAYNFRFRNIKNIALNILATHEINQKDDIKTQYSTFRSFISSSYGAISVASISEIVILIKNYNTIGSIFWMCATIALLGLIQLCEIILNCHYVDSQTKSKSCFICAIQYVSNKYSDKIKNKKLAKIFVKLIIGYGLCMGIISFFSASIFQVEQTANLFVESGGSYKSIIATLGVVLSIIFLLSSIKQFRFALSLNNKIVTPTLLFFIGMAFLFLSLNSQYVMPVLSLAIEDMRNPAAILPGIVSGLVISFARYIYKKYDPEENELESSSYEDTNIRHATTMYTIESFFMMFLVVISGLTFFIVRNYQDVYFFGLNIKYLISVFLVFFAFSVILNEAIYSKALFVHILNLNKQLINWIIRLLLIAGIFMGLFPETDAWVDISDHISIIFLSINLMAFFFVSRDTKNSMEHYKSII